MHVHLLTPLKPLGECQLFKFKLPLCKVEKRKHQCFPFPIKEVEKHQFLNLSAPNLQIQVQSMLAHFLTPMVPLGEHHKRKEIYSSPNCYCVKWKRKHYCFSISDQRSRKALVSPSLSVKKIYRPSSCLYTTSACSVAVSPLLYKAASLKV